MNSPEHHETSGRSVSRRWSLSIQQKFLIGTALILLVFCVLLAALLYVQEKNLLAETAYNKSEMVMAAVEANRNYVRHVLRPKMYEVLGEDAFVLEAMSTSYVSRAVMDRFRKTLPEYAYRRVAINARNPSSEANPLEREMIRYFETDRSRTEWHGIVKLNGISYFYRFKPVYFQESCMHCHGDPSQAPQALVDRYGKDRGFGREPGDVAGVTGVGIPVEVAMAKIKGMALSVGMVGSVCVALLYAVLSFFFNRVVVHNLKDLLGIFQRGLWTDAEQRELAQSMETRDEIQELTILARTMVGRLNEARRRLELHSENLESMVADRTRALQRSQERLRRQVIQRNRELKTLNSIAEMTTQARRLSDILPEVLERTLEIVPAHGAAIYLLKENPDRLELQIANNVDDPLPVLQFDADRCALILEEDHPDYPTSLNEAACGQVSFCEEAEGAAHLNIPLCCRGRVLGVMTFHQVDLDGVKPEMQELLFSIGRQIGVALESLNNLEKLLQSKELLQTVVDGITDMLVLLDREGRIRMVNKAFLQRFGLDMEQVTGRRCTEVHVEGGCAFSPSSLEEVLRTGTPKTEEAHNRQGEVYLIHLYPVLDESGRVDGLIQYAKDITHQKRVEQKIQQTERLVALGQLTAGLAHELNNPLGVILCYTDLLKRQMADFPMGLKDVGIIEKHALNCQRILSDLLKFARGQAGTEPRPASLNQVVEEVVQMMGHQFRKRGIRVELHLADDLPEIPLDVERIKQVVVNLLMNARQAVNGRGLVRVTTRRDGDDLEMRVWDDGPGIDPAIRDKIFDPFFSTKSPGEGTGLGLSVSYGIVQDHGGDISVESEPGQWTEFMVRLPRERKPS
ncbi:PAS domain S-box-containing protein [Desulfacinum hydrothermale DSM 13146]|uniref:histidine kinase n=1 Tax=Desulfacinum hydrothermale DSM 13146 TaxID=1121390 RepID=A0A1W1X9T7_9BACT|nr:DUF3365 domain-containing protein [Desulfacinum hydrothermale]SMC20584.1 PAS domain S-box-containing protein [Desulfacinum hydrothermale DSM 13146]